MDNFLKHDYGIASQVDVVSEGAAPSEGDSGGVQSQD